MRSVLDRAEEVLEGRPSASSWWLALVCGLAYGGVMGSFGGQPAQVVISAIKVPLLLAATTALSLPSFFVLNTLLGVRRDFGLVLQALIGAQVGLTLVLASLAPLTAFWYVSSDDYRAAIAFNAAMFGIASLAAQWMLRRSYRPLIRRSSRHRWLMRGWLVLYAFVGIQMGWVLRPFIGAPDQPVQFIRREAWDNAYVIVAGLIWRLLTGRN